MRMNNPHFCARAKPHRVKTLRFKGLKFNGALTPVRRRFPDTVPIWPKSFCKSGLHMRLYFSRKCIFSWSGATRPPLIPGCGRHGRNLGSYALLFFESANAETDPPHMQSFQEQSRKNLTCGGRHAGN